MRSILAICFSIMLVGCAIKQPVPIVPSFPEVPPLLLEPCPELFLVPEGTTKLSELLKVVVQNYGLYHQCAIKNDTWGEWYREQKSIFEGLGK
jgi:hypothetical protein